MIANSFPTFTPDWVVDLTADELEQRADEYGVGVTVAGDHWYAVVPLPGLDCCIVYRAPIAADERPVA